MSLSLPDFSDPNIWISLLTLTFLEIVLGIDNIIFISIISGKLPPHKQARIINIGLILAMFLRILLLFGVSILISMQKSWFVIDWGFVHGSFSGQSLMLILGGIFLIYKSTSEIHNKLESNGEEEEHVNFNVNSPKTISISTAIFQISLINIIFSFDSILTAVGMTSGLDGALVLMILAVIISVVIMMFFATPVSRFVNRHPSIQLLGLSFLLLIGFMLILEGGHIANFTIGNSTIGTVPKGYLYFAIAFSLFVEMLNIRLQKKSNPVQLRGATETAVKESIIPDDNNAFEDEFESSHKK